MDKLEYEFKYRGFLVQVNKKEFPMHADGIRYLSPVPRAEIGVFDSNSNELLMRPCIALDRDFRSYSQTEIENRARKYIDQEIKLLGYRKNRADSERKNAFLGKLIQSIEGKGQREALSDKLLYDKLTAIGMTPLDIIACGHKELVPFFDREAYAKTIADQLIFLGAENTSEGNWIFDFDEIEDHFGVDFDADKEMLALVKEALEEQGDTLSDIQIYNRQFDLMFYPVHCPYVADFERWGYEDREPEEGQPEKD